MPVVRLQKKRYQLEDRVMEGYAMTYRAYLARRERLSAPRAFVVSMPVNVAQREETDETVLLVEHG